MEDQPIEALRLAAATGDVRALTRLDERLLGGSTPDEFAEATFVLDRAIRAGGVEAPAMLKMRQASIEC